MNTQRVIDYTKFRLHFKPNGLPIEHCPECGRKGELAHYKPTGGRCFHVAIKQPYGLEITDGCFWPKEATR